MDDRKSRFVLYGAAFSVGAATMGAELGAARLVAPFFGTSSMVWALVIGATLLSLSVGQLIGGWLSGRGVGWRGVAWMLTSSAVVLAALPLLGRPLMAGTLEYFYSEAYGTLLASALSVTFLTGLPLLAMGAVGPIFLQLAITDAKRAGQIGSYLYAWGTIGSLLGTYLSGLLMIPLLGTARTLWFFAALLLVTAAFFAFPRRPLLVTLVGVVAFLGAGMTTAPPIKDLPGQIFEAETAHNYVAILDRRGQREMVFNDGFAVQSIYREDDLILEGVWGYYAMAPAWTTTGRPEDVLLLGLGGGTSARQYRAMYPEARVVGVELDPGVVEAGRRFMGLPEDIEVVIEDGRTYLTVTNEHYDLILVDAFQFPYVPFQVTTKEFFALLQSRVKPGGAVLLNVGRDGERHDVVHALVRTAREVFPHVAAVDVPRTYNTILYAGEHPLSEAVGLNSLGLLPEHRMLLGRLSTPGPWDVPPSTSVLTDDRAPVEWLTDLIVLRLFWEGLFR